MGASCGPTRRGRGSRRSTRRRRAMPRRASSRSCGTASFVGVSRRPKHAADAALGAPARRPRPGRRARRCRTRAGLRAWLKSQPVETKVVALARGRGAGSARAHHAALLLAAPIIAHGSIAPSCAIAQWSDGGRAGVVACQGVYNLRADLALVLGLPPESDRGRACRRAPAATAITVPTTSPSTPRSSPARPEGGRCGCNGRGPTSSRARPSAPRMAVEIEADLDARRRDRRLASRHLGQRPRRPPRPQRDADAARRHRARRPLPALRRRQPAACGRRRGGPERGADLRFPAWRITNHRLLAMPLRTSSLRSLGAFANVFAIESFLDELAAERGEDPLAFRLRYLRDPRARAVLEAAAARAGWGVGAEARGGRARARARPLQEHRRLLRRRGRGRGRGGGSGAAPGRRRRCRRGDQPGRRRQPDRGRGDPGDELDAEGSGPLRPRRG